MTVLLTFVGYNRASVKAALILVFIWLAIPHAVPFGLLVQDPAGTPQSQLSALRFVWRSPLTAVAGQGMASPSDHDNAAYREYSVPGGHLSAPSPLGGRMHLPERPSRHLRQPQEAKWVRASVIHHPATLHCSFRRFDLLASSSYLPGILTSSVHHCQFLAIRLCLPHSTTNCRCSQCIRCPKRQRPSCSRSGCALNGLLSLSTSQLRLTAQALLLILTPSRHHAAHG